MTQVGQENTIYILKLNYGKYNCGKSKDPERRINDHKKYPRGFVKKFGVIANGNPVVKKYKRMLRGSRTIVNLARIPSPVVIPIT